MYLVSDNVGNRLINTNDLVRPSIRQKALIQDAYKKLPSYKNINIEWFVKISEWKDSTIAGMATLLSPEETDLSSIPKENDYPYAICICSYVFKESYEYIIYVLTHELKHCIPETSTYGTFSFFRTHEVNLWGKSSKKEDAIFGFFKDEFQDISCCDNLMYMFKSCYGIEEFLG